MSGEETWSEYFHLSSHPLTESTVVKSIELLKPTCEGLAQGAGSNHSFQTPSIWAVTHYTAHPGILAAGRSCK